MSVVEDCNLLEKIKEDNHQALEVIFLKYYSVLCAYANSVLGDKQASEDIVQGLFVKLWDNRKNFTITVSLKAYLYRTTLNLCINYLQKQKVRENYSLSQQAVNELELAFTGDYPAANLLLREMGDKFRESVRALPEQCRQVFMMIRIYGNSYQEVAQKLNISVNTVKTQMQRSMEKLRKMLKDYFPN